MSYLAVMHRPFLQTSYVPFSPPLLQLNSDRRLGSFVRYQSVGGDWKEVHLQRFPVLDENSAFTDPHWVWRGTLYGPEGKAVLLIVLNEGSDTDTHKWRWWQEVMQRDSPRSEPDLSKCICCTEETRSVLLHPCSHVVFCANCAQRAMEESVQCPVCKQEIDAIQSIILS